MKIDSARWVNQDIIRMAESIEAQYNTIRDEEPHAASRRLALFRMAMHMRAAFKQTLILANIEREREMR